MNVQLSWVKKNWVGILCFPLLGVFLASIFWPLKTIEAGSGSVIYLQGNNSDRDRESENTMCIQKASLQLQFRSVPPW